MPLKLKLLLLSSLGSLRTVLGTSLHTTVDALSVEGTADDVVTDTRKVLNTAATDHNDGVLLQVMTDTGDVCGDFVTIGQTYTGDFTQSGVGLLRSRGTDCGADASLLGGAQVGLLVLQGVQTLLHCGRIGLIGDLLSAFPYQLVKSGHCFLLSRFVADMHNQHIKSGVISAFLYSFVGCIFHTHAIVDISIIHKNSQEFLFIE